MSDRKQRGLTQKLYLVESLPKSISFSRTYLVMGSSGNVYTVIITNIPTCTCPDYKKRHQLCKHIYFILHRIMKVVENDDKLKYTNKELNELFKNIPSTFSQNIIVSENIKNKYHRLINKEEVDKRDTDDLCPICLDDLDNNEELDSCKYSCGKYVHKKCFEITVNARGGESKCIFCKESWNKQVGGEYINLN